MSVPPPAQVLSFTYSEDIQGRDLKPGDIIIANGYYGIISHITEDYIYTSAGKRLLFPLYSYPTFVLS